MAINEEVDSVKHLAHGRRHADRYGRVRSCLMSLTGLLVAVGVTGSALAQTIVEEWNEIKAPPPPVLKAVKVDPKDTALLMLDFVKQNCAPRPRCVASLPTVQGMLARARESGVLVIHSLVPNQTLADLVPEVAARQGEASVTSGPDKFLNTDLEKILKERSIKTVIVAGTAAEGAVLNTAAAAALRGFKVIVPVDAASSVNPYSEQYTAWHLANSPRVGPQVTLTKIDLVSF